MKYFRHHARTGASLLGAALFAITATCTSPLARAQAAPTADVVVFTNGDQLVGKFESGAGNSIVFKSDMAGEITIPLDKVKELRVNGSFVVLRKDMTLKSAADARARVKPGAIAYGDAKLTVTPASASPEVIPEAQLANIIDQATFDKETTGKTGFSSGWTGAINGGGTIVRATDYGETFTVGIGMARTMPGIPFLPTRNRTSFDLQETYGKLTSPVIPQTTPASPAAVTETSILHADAEQDEFFSSRLFGLVQIAFDHNYSQGLALQQIYGGGLGYSVLKDAKQQLDVKATVQYEKQGFTAPASNVNLIGSTISETYHRALPKKLVLSEFGNFIPAFTNSNDYSANVSGTLTLPVYKRLSVGFTATDNYLNNPAPGYNKNSSQFIANVSYSLK